MTVIILKLMMMMQHIILVIPVAIAIVGTSLVMAQKSSHNYVKVHKSSCNDTCTKRYGFDIECPGKSCADIYNKNPASHGKSGYYVLKTDRLFFAYCDMVLECGCYKGWMRIADIDIKKGDTCPSGWRKYRSYCTGGSAAGCYSAKFPTDSTMYGKVCGKVVGYQKGTMDGFFPSAYAHGRVNHYVPRTSSRSLDGVYVDGISITCGNPRKHVWTYVVGSSDDHKPDHQLNCPCAKYPGPGPPTYVGSHYYCESGKTGAHTNTHILYNGDPLWDGKGCGSENSCCYEAGMPWFFRKFPIAKTGDIEVRICYDELFSNEAVVVEQIQLYVA